MMADLFARKHHAEIYAQFRPTYPIDVALKVVEYGGRERFDTMVDVGCGNGQSTMLFSPHFNNIIAIDVSESQIAVAKSIASSDYKNIEFKVATAEAIPVEDKSVDVVCSGEAIHWVDWNKFWQECYRILKPGGIVVLYAYHVPNVVPLNPGSPRPTQDLKSDAYKLTTHVRSVFQRHEGSRHVDDRYSKLFELIPAKEKHRDDSLVMEKRWTMSAYKNHLITWSGYQKFLAERKQGGDGKDMMLEYFDNLKQLFGCDQMADESINLLVSWDIFMLFSRP